MEFEQVIRQHRKMILGIAFRIVRNPDAAEEVLQETLFKVWRSFASFEHECALATWIAVIARNTSISYLRVASKHRCSPLVDASGIAARHHDHWAPLEIKQHVDRLPDWQRLVIDLYYYQGWRVKEIASLLEIPNATVRGRLFCARRALALSINGAPASAVTV